MNKGRKAYSAVISLNGRVAENKGYYSRDTWEKLLELKIPVIARGMQISMSDLRWCAAYHNEFGHPHCHIVFWDDSSKVHGNMTKSKFIRYTEDIKKSINENIFGKDIAELLHSSKDEEKILSEHLAAMLDKELTLDNEYLKDFTLSGRVYSPTKYSTGTTDRLMKLLDTAIMSIPKEVDIQAISYERGGYALKKSLSSCVDQLLEVSTDISKAYTRYMDSEIDRVSLLTDKDSQLYTTLLHQSKEKIYAAISNILIDFILKNELYKFSEANSDIYIRAALEKLNKTNIIDEDVIYTSSFSKLKLAQKEYRSLFGDNESNAALFKALSSIIPEMEINNTIIQAYMLDKLPEGIINMIEPLSDKEKTYIAKSVAFSAMKNTVSSRLSAEDIRNIALDELYSILARYEKNNKVSFSEEICKSVAGTISQSMMIRAAIRGGLDISSELERVFDTATSKLLLKACENELSAWTEIDNSFLQAGTNTARGYIESKLLTDSDNLPTSIRTSFCRKASIRQLLNITRDDRKRLGEQLSRLARQKLGFEDKLTAIINENITDKELLHSVLLELKQKLIEGINEVYKKEMEQSNEGIFAKNIAAINPSEIYKELLKLSPKVCDIAVDIYTAQRLLMDAAPDDAQRRSFFNTLNYTRATMIYTQLLNSIGSERLEEYTQKRWSDYISRINELVKSENLELRQRIADLLSRTPKAYQSYDTFMDEDYKKIMGRILWTRIIKK